MELPAIFFGWNGGQGPNSSNTNGQGSNSHNKTYLHPDLSQKLVIKLMEKYSCLYYRGHEHDDVENFTNTNYSEQIKSFMATIEEKRNLWQACVNQ